MNEMLIQLDTMVGIADAIREKTGKADVIPITELASEIKEIETGITPSGSIEITRNGTHDVSGYASAEVNVPTEIPDEYIIPSGTLEIAENGTHDVIEYASVEVDVPIPDGYIVPNGRLDITENGTHDVTEYDSVDVDVPIPDGYVFPLGTKDIYANGMHDVSGFESVYVEVPTDDGTAIAPMLQEKEVSENCVVTPDPGFYGLSAVYVDVPIPECSGSHIIEVDELLTENIDVNAVYLCKGAYYACVKTTEFVDVVIVSDGEATRFTDLSQEAGIECSFQTITTSAMPVNPLEFILFGQHHFYYAEDLPDFGVGVFNNGSWHSFANEFGMPYNGTITDISEVTQDGVYAVVTPAGGWKKYLVPVGTLTVTEVGTFDVTTYKSVALNIAGVSFVQTAEELPLNAPVGSVAFVLKGGS